jgi:DNA-binding response OmpR family regulator
VKRVTVVDDDEDICTLVRHQLTTMGMAVDVHLDGRSGLDAIVADPPDLAIIDVMMPGIGGLDVTRALRTNHATKELPIVIFSALVRPQDELEGLMAGADRYVIKPFSVAALGAFVDKILGLHTCTVCGTRRDDDSAIPEDMPAGWTTSTYGDICGECQVKGVDKLRLAVETSG